MNWTAISTIAEVIATATVVITLLYLSVQLRQNNKFLREQAWQHMLQNQLSYCDGMAREPDLVNVVYGISRDDVEATDKMKAVSHAMAEFFRWQWEYLRVKEGVNGDSALPVPGFRREWKLANLGFHWEKQKHVFHPDFVAFIDKNVAQPCKEGDEDA